MDQHGLLYPTLLSVTHRQRMQQSTTAGKSEHIVLLT